eukprot:479993_1
MSASTLFCDGQQYPGYFVTGCLLHAVGFFLTIIAFLGYIRALIKNKNTSVTSEKFQWLLIISSIVCILMNLSGVIAYIACYNNLILLSRSLRAIFIILMIALLTIVIFSFLLRINQSFKTSVYEISSKLYITLLTLTAMSAIFVAIGAAMFLIFLYTNKTFTKIGLWTIVGGVVPCLFVWVTVSILFVRKLCLLTIESNKEIRKETNLSTIKNANSATNSASISRSFSNLSAFAGNNKKKKLKMIMVATRCVVINGFVWLLSLLMIVIIYFTFQGIYNPITIQIWGYIMEVYGTAHFVAVYLQYPFSSNLYRKLCFGLDFCCYKMLNKYIEISVRSTANVKKLEKYVGENEMSQGTVESPSAQTCTETNGATM